jgi:hypothetical protein
MIPTRSNTINVKIYWVSSTLNVSKGGTKKKSNASTLKTETRIDGPNPQKIAVTTTVSK